MTKVLDETRRDDEHGSEAKIDVYSAFEILQKELGFPMEINLKFPGISCNYT